MTGAFPGFSLGVLVMGQGPVEARENAQCFPRRGGRVCASAAPAASPGVSVCDLPAPEGLSSIYQGFSSLNPDAPTTYGAHA